MDNREIDTIIQETKDHFIDRSLVFFEKPIEKIMNKTISLYHGSYEVIHDKLKPMGVNVGATKYSKIRWSTYYWDNFESAVRWSVAWAVKKFGEVGVMWPIRKEHGTKILLRNNKGISDDEFKNEIARQKIVTYVYEIKIPANDIEIGSVASIKEYTISHPVKIYKTHSIIVTKDMLDRYFRIVDEDEWKDARDANKFECLVYNRGPILNRILDNHRDPYRIIVRKAQRDGLINVGDDLSGYKQKIEHSIKYDTLGLNIKEENVDIMFTEEELLEAVDILIEDYGYYEDEAIDILVESFEEYGEEEIDDEELEDLMEAVDILMEDYGYEEDEALDMILESYEDELNEDFKFKKGEKTGHVGYKGGQPHDKAMIRPTFQGAWGPVVYEYDGQKGKLEPGQYNERLGKGKKGPKDKTIRTFSKREGSKTNPGRGARYNLNLFKKYPDDTMADRFGGVTTKSTKKLAKHINFKDDKKLSKIYNNHKTAVKIKTTINDNKKKIAVGAGAAIGGGAYLAYRANKKRNRKRRFRRR